MFNLREMESYNIIYGRSRIISITFFQFKAIFFENMRILTYLMHLEVCLLHLLKSLSSNLPFNHAVLNVE